MNAKRLIVVVPSIIFKAICGLFFLHYSLHLFDVSFAGLKVATLEWHYWFYWSIEIVALMCALISYEIINSIKDLFDR